MKSLPPPALCVQELLDSFSTKSQDLLSPEEAASIKSAELEYLRLGPPAELFAHTEGTTERPAAFKNKMGRLYSNRLVHRRAAGRKYYDHLLNSAPGGICPLCGHALARTLDHYLPKATHPSLAITPANLVPACSDCNKAKSATVAATAGDQTLHPYFDSVDSTTWLVASVLETNPPSIRFSAIPPSSWGVLEVRVKAHFKAFGLAEMYSVQAGVAMTGIHQQLCRVSDDGGPDLVRQHLEQTANSWAAVSCNSWQAALYAALSKSPWFCSRGFRLLRKE